MPGRKANIVATKIGGYKPPTSSDLKNITLPEKIRCVRCQKWKARPNYSNKQLNDAKNQILRYGVNCNLDLRCRTCTGSAPVEMTCGMCKKTKGIESFSKNQRKMDNDNAKCTSCINQQVDRSPADDFEGIDNYGSDSEEETDDEAEEEEAKAQYHDFESADKPVVSGGVSLSTPEAQLNTVMSGMSTSGSSRRGAESVSNGLTSRQFGWKELSNAKPLVSNKSPSSSAAAATGVPSGSAEPASASNSYASRLTNAPGASAARGASLPFNPNNYGNPRAESTYAPSSVGTGNTNATEHTAKQCMPRGQRNTKFAKVPAYQNKNKIDLWDSDNEQSPESEEENDDDSDDDDDDDDDYDE